MKCLWLLQEMPSGAECTPAIALIKLPDLQEVARHIAEGHLEQPLYTSPMGDICALDILVWASRFIIPGPATVFMSHRHLVFSSDHASGPQ